MRARFDEDDVEKRRLADDVAIDGDVGARDIHEHRDVSGTSLRFGETFFSGHFLLGRCVWHVAQELLQVHRAVFDAIGLQFGLAEIQQHGGVFLELIGLQESAARIFEAAGIECLHAFFVTLARDFRHRVVGESIRAAQGRWQKSHSGQQSRSSEREEQGSDASACFHQTLGISGSSPTS